MGDKRKAPPNNVEPSDETLVERYGDLADEYAAVREESSALAGKEDESAEWQKRKVNLAQANPKNPG